MYNLPKCCGVEMKIQIEANKFLEVQCPKCKDIVFIKKESIEKPQLLDD